MEALGALLTKAKEVGLVSGFLAGRGEVVVTHLQFANETSTRWEEAVSLKRILRCFQYLPLVYIVQLPKTFTYTRLREE